MYNEITTFLFSNRITISVKSCHLMTLSITYCLSELLILLQRSITSKYLINKYYTDGSIKSLRTYKIWASSNNWQNLITVTSTIFEILGWLVSPQFQSGYWWLLLILYFQSGSHIFCYITCSLEPILCYDIYSLGANWNNRH